VHPQPSDHGTPNRTADAMLRQFEAQGYITTEAKRPLVHLASTLMLAMCPLPLLLGAVVSIAALAGRFDEAQWLGPVFLVLGAAALWGGLRLRRGARRARGAHWLVDTRGITIDGVGPVPWCDLEPPTQRMESAPYDDGYQLTLVLPLTAVGAQRALALPPAARRVLNAAVRDTLLTGPQPVTSIRVPAMKEMPADHFAWFLDQIRLRYGARP